MTYFSGYTVNPTYYDTYSYLLYDVCYMLICIRSEYYTKSNKNYNFCFLEHVPIQITSISKQFLSREVVNENTLLRK